jgi:sulfhydrogenase subunit delta
MALNMAKPKIGVFSLTGCGGDQLMILNLEDILLELLNRFDIKNFQEASSYHEKTSLDIAFVEGSVSTKGDLKKLLEVRETSKKLIAIGNCAIDGCVQAMRNNQMSIVDKMKKVYGVEEDLYDALEPRGLSEYVKIDLEIPGCPIEKDEIFRVITSIMHGDIPEQIDYPVCVECKLKGYPCVLVEKGMPCLGPIATAGCGARCPSLGLDCIGCRGPVKNEANVGAETETLRKKGYGEEYIINRLKIFGGNFGDIVMLTKKLHGSSENQ